MHRYAIAVLIVLFSAVPATSSDSSLMEKRCEKGKRATDYESWEFIANNAARTADEYAMYKNPMATFVLSDVEAVFQFGGDHAGEYLVKLVSTAPTGTAFAMLRPNFQFCADPSNLDDERDDLFTVISAKLNGKPF